MNIANALKSAAAAFPQRERRAALAQFLRRYSEKCAASHYRCIGGDCDAIVAFLSAAGFGESDYSVVESSYDRATRQIRWADGSVALSELCEGLRGANADALYASLVLRDDVDAAAGMLPGGPDGPSEQDGPPMLGIEEANDRILAELAAVQPAPSTAAHRFAQRYSAPENRAQRPFVLPMWVLEAWAVGTGRVGTDEDGMMFGESPVTTDVFCRFVRMDEELPRTDRILSAPVTMMMSIEKDVDEDDNPLRGYLSGYASELNYQSDRRCLYAVGAAVTGLDEPTLVARLRDMQDPRCAARRIASIMEAAYGRRVLVVGCRVGLDQSDGVWPYDSDERDDICGYAVGPRRRSVGGTTVPQACVKYAVLMTPDEPWGPDEATRNIGDCPRVRVETTTDGSAPTVGTNAFPSASDAPAELFAMVHGGFSAGAGRPTGTEDGERVVGRLRAFSSGTTAAGASLLSEARSAHLAPPDDPAAAHTPRQAFVNSVVAILRSSWRTRNGADLELPMVSYGRRRPDRVVDSVYTGVAGPSAPSMAGFLADPSGECFPDMSSVPTMTLYDGVADAMAVANEPGAARASSVVAELRGHPLAQFRTAANASDVWPERSVLVVTNVLWDRFVVGRGDGESSPSDLVARLRLAFVNAFCGRTGDPRIAYGGVMRPFSATHDYIINEMKAVGVDWNDWMDAPACSGRYCLSRSDIDGDVSVGSCRGVDGRLVIVFGVSGRTARYMTAAWRFAVGLPLPSAEDMDGIVGHGPVNCGDASPDGQVRAAAKLVVRCIVQGTIEPAVTCQYIESSGNYQTPDRCWFAGDDEGVTPSEEFARHAS